MICPYCGQQVARIDALVKKGEPPSYPENGDRSFCAHCGKPSVFDSGLATGLRRPTDDEAREDAGNELLQTISRSWHDAMKVLRR